MKKVLIFIVSILAASLIQAQDTLYIYEGGNVTYKQSVAKIDSMTFIKPKLVVNPGGPTPLSGNLVTQTLDANKQYLLNGLVYVQSGNTLTIPAGTVIMGDKASKGALVINRGGKLIANGTAAKPIVFTSSAPAGYKKPGDWGGIVICGKAPNNQGTTIAMEGPTDFSVSSGTDNGLYGGSDEADNSGSLKYIRIEYAGVAYAPNKEINALSLCSVGSGTTIDHIQVSFCGDDAFEWFGGTVNAKYLVSYTAWDDDFDTDLGYHGKVQFGVVFRDPVMADQTGSNGFESDNDPAGTSLTPQTTAQFSNISILGPYVFAARNVVDSSLVAGNINANYQNIAHLRRNSAQGIYNSVLLGFKTGINFEKTSGILKVKNNVIGVFQTRASFTSGMGNDTTGFVASNTWTSTKKVTDVLASISVVKDAGFLAPASPALTGAVFSGNGLTDSFWTPTTYRGAFGTTPDAAWNWNSGWLNFDPQNTQY